MSESHVPVGAKLAEAWQLPEPVKEAIVFYQDHTYHQATSPTKGAIITCLADHMASYLLDSSYDRRRRTSSSPCRAGSQFLSRRYERST